MNRKAMNLKKGLKRFWIVGSVFWLLYPIIPSQGYAFGIRINDWDELILYAITSQIVWWSLLYVGFWVARGFVDDDDNKAGF
jgi:hypothetical protein